MPTPKFETGFTFADQQILTYENLNAAVNLANPTSYFIGAQTLLTDPINSLDELIINDVSGPNLRKITFSQLYSSGFAFTNVPSINGVSGSNLVITPGANQLLSIVGNSSITGNLSVSGTSYFTGNITAGSTLSVVGHASFNSTEAIKLPVGTTLQRPLTAVAGQIRYNSSFNATEVYNGTSWDAVPVAGTNLTLPNTVNFTGEIQFNGTPVYALAEVYEESIPNYSSYTNGIKYFTSAPFTKPSDEIWVFEIDTNGYISGPSNSYNSPQVGYWTFTNSANTTVWNAYCLYMLVTPTSFVAKWVVKAGTALNVETVNIWRNAGSSGLTGVGLASSGIGSVNKMRIYKYRTA